MSKTFKVAYAAGSAPGANSNTYGLVDTTASAAQLVGDASSCFRQGLLRRYLLALKTAAVGTLKGYASADGGANWHQFFNRVIPATEAVVMRHVAVRIDQHRDVKFEWVNGGSAQSTWYVGQALTDDIDGVIATGYDDPAYIASGSMVHSVTTAGAAIQVGPEGQLVATAQWAATGTAVGTLSIEFTHNGVDWKPIPGASAQFTADGKLQPNNNVGDYTYHWRELLAYKRVRIKYVSTSGGAANTSLNVQISTW
jgi:hypothetical protein